MRGLLSGHTSATGNQRHANHAVTDVLLAESWSSGGRELETPGHCSVGVTPFRRRRPRPPPSSRITGDDVAANAPMIKVVSSTTLTHHGTGSIGVRLDPATGCWD